MNFAPVIIKVAIDGNIIISGNEADVNSNQSNVAFSITFLEDKEALDFIKNFRKAKRQIAIHDGIGAKTHLFTARGSTKAGEVLEKCLTE